MNVDYEVTGQDITAAEVFTFEAGAKIRLPPQYRAFILKNNGCWIKGMTTFDTGFEADVHQFNPLFVLKKSKIGTVVTCDNDMIWFACDSGGGRFGIAHTGHNFGKVFWFDMPHSDILSPTSADCRLVAQTFDAFIASIVPMTDEHPAGN